MRGRVPRAQAEAREVEEIQHLRHVALPHQRRIGLEQQVVEHHRLAEVEQRAAHYFLVSSERSVAGAGVRDSAAISARSSGVIASFTQSSRAWSRSRLRAPMIGAVTAGCAPTHATATLIGCQPRLRQKSAKRGAVSCIQASPERLSYILLVASRPCGPFCAYLPESRPPPAGL